VVLRNLLSNAIKYTEHGGTAWVRTRADDEWALLEVEDTGIGMDPEQTDELFEAFMQESEGLAGAGVRGHRARARSVPPGR
jgi:signal transduction histidine kinase